MVHVAHVLVTPIKATTAKCYLGRISLTLLKQWISSTSFGVLFRTVQGCPAGSIQMFTTSITKLTWMTISKTPRYPIPSCTPASFWRISGTTIFLYDAHSPQYFTWVERDLGQCALALLKHYKDPESGVLSRTFYAASAKSSYTEFASILQEALGKPVSFASSPTTGMQEMDDMYAFQSEYGLYPHTTIPDPRLIDLGVKFHTIEEFSQEIKGRYA